MEVMRNVFVNYTAILLLLLIDGSKCELIVPYTIQQSSILVERIPTHTHTHTSARNDKWLAQYVANMLIEKGSSACNWQKQVMCHCKLITWMCKRNYTYIKRFFTNYGRSSMLIKRKWNLPRCIMRMGDFNTFLRFENLRWYILRQYFSTEVHRN
jgi:hypothetical protein